MGRQEIKRGRLNMAGQDLAERETKRLQYLMLELVGIPENKDFSYLGQTTDLRECGPYKLLTTHISGMSCGSPLMYAVKTAVVVPGVRPGEGFMEVMDTKEKGRFIKIMEEIDAKEGRLTWDNGLSAHFYIVEGLKLGKKIGIKEVREAIWHKKSGCFGRTCYL